MRFGKVIFLVLFACFVVHAQSPKQIKILNNYGEIPFEDGKTIIAEVSFTGLDFISEGEVSRILREQRATIKAGEEFHGYKVAIAVRVLRELLASKGYNRAEVIAFGETLPKNQMKLVFDIKRGALAQVSEIRFDGNVNIASEELIANFKECSGDTWEIFDQRKFSFYLRQCSLRFMFSKGYFQARILEPKLQLVSDSYVVTINISEGVRFRYGEITIKGANVFTEKEILEFGGIKTGEVADGKNLQKFIYEKLKIIYGERGYVLYDAEFEPKFNEPQKEGEDATVDLLITIDEGRQFKLGKIEFIGVEKERANEFRRFFSLADGDIYNQSKIEEGFEKINELQEFYMLDSNSTNVEIRIKRRPEQIEGTLIAEKDEVVLRERVDNYDTDNNQDYDKINLVIKLQKPQQ
jgi:outer membrane protein insertion porin family